VRDLPRKLTVDELAGLFEGRTRFVERLAELDDPLGRAREVAAALPDDEKREVLNAHPAIGARKNLSARSAAEQGAAEQGHFDPSELDELNRKYEERFGFRFVVFVNGRPKRELVPVLRARLARTRDEELATAIDELCAIAEDRWRRS
jgi:2-oxo-4-hydroxy-4-carboxy--5-ureidoimidazoline (OHCU) decarboxylase